MFGEPNSKMILLFLTYIFAQYFFVTKRIVNVATLGLAYILVSIIVGENTIFYSQNLVSKFDMSFANMAIRQLKVAFLLTTIIVFLFQIAFPEKRLISSSKINLESLISANSSWLLILLLAIPLYLVFFEIYVPVFQEKTHVSKYFQDKLKEFIPYRPFYTLSINGLSTLLFLQLNNLILNGKKFNFLFAFSSKKFYKVFFIAMSLFFTAKRGQLFFPMFICLISFLLYKRKFIKLTVYGSLTIVLISLARNMKQILSGKFDIQDVAMSFSTSFFVSVRELTRVLDSFVNGGHSYLYGKTYVAGLFSFVPTSINKLKEKYNYMRYTSYISNQNPDDFGGMRSTFVGEAYINFGFLGIICISIVFGLAIYLIYLWIKKYTANKFVYYIFTFWTLKLIILPFYENGSSMLLFFFITICFMIVPNLRLVLSRKMTVLKVDFLSKDGYREI